jgi:hypothetical protein
LCVYHSSECETYNFRCKFVWWLKNKKKLMTVCPNLIVMCQGDYEMVQELRTK